MTREPGSIPVLSLGSHNFFVARLYAEIRRRRPEFAFVVSDYRRYGEAADVGEAEAFAGHIRT